MKFDAWYMTDKGLVRESNQDSCLVNKDLGLFVVADGMGGHSGGEVASSLAVETFEEVVMNAKGKSISARELMNKGYIESSQRIFDKAANERPELTGMGTTMVAALIRDHRFYVGNVGDSRCYLYREPNLWQMTEDHSLVNEQVRAGGMTEDQVKQIVGRNVITRSVGYEREVHPDVLERELIAGESYLLCSDGLYTMVEDDEIARILRETPPDQVVRACLDHSLANGGDDNVTIMYIRFSE